MKMVVGKKLILGISLCLIVLLAGLLSQRHFHQKQTEKDICVVNEEKGEKSIFTKEERASILFEIARRYEVEKDYETAIEKYRKIIESFPQEDYLIHEVKEHMEFCQERIEKRSPEKKMNIKLPKIAFTDALFSEVVDFFSGKLDVKIVVDDKVSKLVDENPDKYHITANPPIKNTEFGKVLEMVLEPKGLAYIVEGNAIKIIIRNSDKSNK